MGGCGPDCEAQTAKLHCCCRSVSCTVVVVSSIRSGLQNKHVQAPLTLHHKKGMGPSKKLSTAVSTMPAQRRTIFHTSAGHEKAVAVRYTQSKWCLLRACRRGTSLPICLRPTARTSSTRCKHTHPMGDEECRMSPLVPFPLAHMPSSLYGNRCPKRDIGMQPCSGSMTLSNVNNTP